MQKVVRPLPLCHDDLEIGLGLQSIALSDLTGDRLRQSGLALFG